MSPVSAPSKKFVHGLIACSDVPRIFSRPSEWKKLHSLTISVELHDAISIERITEFLTEFRPQALQDVTTQFRVVDKEMIYSVHRSAQYAGECLELQAALSTFRHHRLCILLSPQVSHRKHLWTREIGQHFPALRHCNRLTITCESSERFTQSIPMTS